MLATAGGSPDWLLGPLRGLGPSGADGRLAGPLFYLGLWLAMLAYVAVLLLRARIGPRLAVGAIARCTCSSCSRRRCSRRTSSATSPTRGSTSCITSPVYAQPGCDTERRGFRVRGSKDASSAYGPLFTIVTLPLAKLWRPARVLDPEGSARRSRPSAIVALTWACARRLGRDPVFAALVVGLNPLVLVHVVGGAHNDALTCCCGWARPARYCRPDARIRRPERSPRPERWS